MSCRIIELNTLSNNSSIGVWSYDGYSATPGVSPGAGGTDPGDISGPNPSVNTQGWIPGVYYFTKTVSQAGCEDDTMQASIYVQDIGSAGTGGQLDFCTTETGLRFLNAGLSGATGAGVWSVSANSPNSPGTNFNPNNGTIDLSGLNTPGTYIFDYKVELNNVSGYDTINCIACVSLTSVTVIITAPCSAGTSASHAYTSTTGNQNLFNLLGGTPDITVEWEQIEGETTIPISGGYLGTINLDTAAGCLYRFRSSCPGPDGCTNTAIVTLTKGADFNISITYNEGTDTITSNALGCSGTITYQWQIQNGGVWEDIVGQTGSSLSNPNEETFYRLEGTCDGCQVISNVVFIPIDCDCNASTLAFSFNSGSDCLTINKTGTECNPIESDVVQYRINGGSWIEGDEICGCDLRDFLDVTPTCSANTTSIIIGFNNVQRCGGNIDRVYLIFGNDTIQTYSGTDITSDFYVISKNDFINVYNRNIKIVIQLNLGGGQYLHQEISFFYSGDGSSGSSCAAVTITKLNYPKRFKQIDARRIVNFSNNCDPTTYTDSWNPPNPCANFYVLLQQVNLGGGDSGISATTFNCPSVNYQWFRNGAILNGETSVIVNTTTYGPGFYEVFVTGCGCTGSGALNTAACTTSISLALSGSTYTATFTGCAGNRQWIWERFENGSYTQVKNVTNSNSTDNYTPTVSGSYRVRAICIANDCTGTIDFTVDIACTVAVSLVQVGNDLVATASNCSGTKNFIFERLVGGTYQIVANIGTSNNTQNFTPTQSGQYRVRLICAANNCTAEDEVPFVFNCTVSVNVTGPVSGVYTGTISNCSGTKTWLWKRIEANNSVTILRDVTNANLSDSYTPATAGNYQLEVICGANSCSDTFNFPHSLDCDVSATITPNLPSLSANAFGCSGTVSFSWYYRPTPGSGTWGSVISNNQTINTNNWGSGQYRVDVSCGGCFAQAFYTLQAVNPTVSVNCDNSDPFIAVVSPVGGTFQWQFSPTGTGWSNLGTAQTQYPTEGEGYYRVVYFYPGSDPVTATCFFESACSGSATLSATNDKCNWSCPVNVDGNSSNNLLVVINGQTAINGSYNLQISTDRNNFKTALESWLANNNHGGTVSFNIDIYGKFGICININCTKANPERIEYTSNSDGVLTTYFGNCGKSCTYLYTFTDNDCDTIFDFRYGCTSINASLNITTDGPAIKTFVENALTGAGYTGVATVNMAARTLSIVTNAPMGTYSQARNDVGQTSCTLTVQRSATQSSCGSPIRIHPTINLAISGCSGTQTITWQYRSDPGNPFTAVQNGGSSYNPQCADGQIQAVVSCGGCTYESNIITL